MEGCTSVMKKYLLDNLLYPSSPTRDGHFPALCIPSGTQEREGEGRALCSTRENKQRCFLGSSAANGSRRSVVGSHEDSVCWRNWGTPQSSRGGHVGHGMLSNHPSMQAKAESPKVSQKLSLVWQRWDFFHLRSWLAKDWNSQFSALFRAC